MAEEEEAEEEEEDDDVFYAPSFVDRRRKRHKKNTGDDEDEEEEALNTKDVFGGTSSSSSDDDDDDEKEEEEEEEEEEETKDARTRRKQKEEEEAGVVVSESESESDQSFPRKAALKNTCNNVSRRERTTRAGAVDEKTREATALMRELTKRTDAKILDEDEDEEEIAEKDEKGNNDDDDDDDILSHYEPITLVFALSNTNKLELETCAKFTFKRIWTDFVSMHVLEGNAEKARLNFDGDVIKFDEDTPKSLGMENDDCVDVIM